MDLPEYSYWIIAGLALVIAEFAVSGLVVIFFGIAALLVGCLKFLGLLDDTAWELTLFAMTSLLLLVFVRRVINDKLMGTERQRQGEEDSAGLVGARATVAEAFSNGVGTVVLSGRPLAGPVRSPPASGRHGAHHPTRRSLAHRRALDTWTTDAG